MKPRLQQPKAILLDVDGVLVRPPHYYSRELAKVGYSRAENCLNAYFQGDAHKTCLIGKADAGEAISPHLKDIGLRLSPDVFFQQQFRFEQQFLDDEMIGIVSGLRRQGLLCCLATDQEKFRAQYLLEEMNFKSIFDRHFISCLVGARKCHSAFWTHVIEELAASGISPGETIFFDDIQANVDVASAIGICGFRFETVPGFKSQLVKIGLRLT